MIIISACDIKYEPMMRCLVRSVLTNTPYDIIVKYLSTGDEDQAAIADYCANYRLKMFRDYIHKDDLLWLDADTIIRGDITGLERMIREHHVAAVHTPEMGQPGTMNHWLISTVGIANSADGRVFLDIWKEEQDKIHKDWYPSIMTVQQSFVSALDRLRLWLQPKDITYHYSDKNMQDESPIWEGQGARKYEDQKFLIEIKKYM